ncbi:efflux RND transporter periplasmic adaptor subunit [Desulfurivibrio sp. D14AmB]|uniref:efflux RND transporter periplasmic adaptor subunit n=1 Tax=Desulfurivibrio sp. D14AmB TaxID=3374370 RepID=UPI00376F116B
MKRWRTGLQAVLVAILVLTLIALVGWRLYRVTRPLPPPQAIHPLVEIQTLTVQALELWADYVGTVEARRRASVSALVGGRLAELPRREGETVSKDELLIRLDQRELRAERDRLVAALAGAAAEVVFWRERLAAEESLLGQGAISRLEVDTTRRILQTAEAGHREKSEALEVARLRHSHAEILAPFAGLIARVHIDPEETVGVGQPLLELVSHRELKAVIPVPQNDLAALAVGQEARLSVAALGLDWSAQVDRLHPDLDRQSRSGTLEIFFGNDFSTAAQQLRPGMAVRARILQARIADTLLVPGAALRQRGDERGVFLYRDGLAHWRPVAPGLTAADGRVQISAGLAPGEQLIITPHPELADARPVRVR